MDIHLDGAEITILKAIGFSGGDIPGEGVLERASGLDDGEFLEALKGLVVMGYVYSDTTRFASMDEVKRANFHVNSGYVKAIRESMDPSQDRKTKRVRRE